MTENDELSEGERGALSAILGQLGLVCPVEGSSSCSLQMNAAHLLVSALEGEGSRIRRIHHCYHFIFITVLLAFDFISELPDETLNLLGRSPPEFLEAFDKLVSSCYHVNLSLLCRYCF